MKLSAMVESLVRNHTPQQSTQMFRYPSFSAMSNTLATALQAKNRLSNASAIDNSHSEAIMSAPQIIIQWVAEIGTGHKYSYHALVGKKAYLETK